MRPRKGGTLFGHGSDCYNWDNRCHCGSDQPLQLPPEENSYNYTYNGGSIHSSNGSRSGALSDRVEPSLATPGRQLNGVPHLNTLASSSNLVPQQSLHGYGNLPRKLPHRGSQSVDTSREQINGAQGRGEPPLLGHAPQCYLVDNKCHCSSSEPYRLPPESPVHSHVPQHQDHLYYSLPFTMSANSYPNTTLQHQSYIDSATDRQSRKDFGALSIQHNQQTATHSTNPSRPPGQYSNPVESQVYPQLGSPSHDTSGDLPPSYSELFPDR